MNNWRESLLKEFVPNVSQLTLVADPDSLLTEEKLSQELRQRGFELIEFKDPVEFRYAYEANYRSVWDSDEPTNLVVILHLQEAELTSLPYDLLQSGRQISITLCDLFPNLSYPVLQKLDRSLLDVLFEAQRKTSPDRMGDKGTKDFLLRHVFGIAAELLTNEVELLRTLLRLHYSQTQIPAILSERLVEVLQTNKIFKSWPLKELVSEDQDFFAFLQERWPVFLERLNNKELESEGVQEQTQNSFHYSGPALLPFDHQDIRVYIDNLFVEGRLTPVHKPMLDPVIDSWVRCGMFETAEDEETRISRLFELIRKVIPPEDSRYSDWTVFALKWAELAALVHCSQNETNKNQLLELGKFMNALFSKWLSQHYASLVNLPPTVPAMLHQVPRRLARDLEKSKESRIALVVVDGLALDQWVTMRQSLQKQDKTLVMRESALFTWIPTLTSVARQALFSGKAPFFFPSTIHSTNSEESLWKVFWEGVGLPRRDIAYQRGLGDGEIVSVLENNFHPEKTRVVGLVLDKVDKIMHGMQLGAAGMHNQIKQWCEGGFLKSLIDYLLVHGFEIWMTSDHGNVQCQGQGRPSEGAIAEIRGERVRIYPTPELRTLVANTFTFAQEWQSVGLPAAFFPLVAGGYNAFVNPDETIVGHGGISLEEVIVPLVKFERRKP
ncbi:BREX-3 system phosphatase PglZ [Deltaproteobacteria bacterium TL4]